MASRYNMDLTLIFLGPSLPAKEAQALLPHAKILPPVQSGDILRAMRLKPTLIILIDGYFENMAAVWHKEILYAVEQGVNVVAGGSMGALRASELSDFGVMPMGKIAEAYLDNTLQDDDEVAVLHRPKQFGYLPLTDAMVNIRATLSLAHQQHIINESSQQTIEKIAKQLYYPERTLQQAMRLAAQQGVDEQQINRLETWLNEPSHYQDIKKQDAIFILTSIAQSVEQPEKNSLTVNRTAFFRALQLNVQCRPFSSYQSWLPVQEKAALAARYLGSAYRLIRRLAYLLAACYGLAKQQSMPSRIEDKVTLDEFGLHNLFYDNHWKEKNDCTDDEKQAFSQRMSMIISLFKKEQLLTNVPGNYRDYLLLLMRLSGDYSKYKTAILITDKHQIEKNILYYFKIEQPQKYRLLFYIAHCWWVIERAALRLGLQVNDDSLQQDSDNFRRHHKLHTTEALEQWLVNNDMDLASYQYFMAANFRLRFLIFENNIDILNPSFEDVPHWWLLDALWLSDYYMEAKKMLIDPILLKRVKMQAKSQTNNLDSYAYSLDFMGGEQEFLNEEFEVEPLATSVLAKDSPAA